MIHVHVCEFVSKNNNKIDAPKNNYSMVILTDIVRRADEGKYEKTGHVEEAVRERLGARTEVFCENIFKN